MNKTFHFFAAICLSSQLFFASESYKKSDDEVYLERYKNEILAYFESYIKLGRLNNSPESRENYNRRFQNYLNENALRSARFIVAKDQFLKREDIKTKIRNLGWFLI